MSGEKDFSCIGGLEKHIRIVKEMVLFPLMYGDIYAKFNLRPPRGLLFYGPPGTGKTLVASALSAECSNSERKVSFISRKGSDCLSKYVGESERKLQKIFSMAQQSKPCIIFFDEVDGLAPIRSSRQDFVHVSVVSTLLALMDGLENNSEIIVIGATNRIDAIDPALRRPGRFDRELYFPLPCYKARKDILLVHVKSWKQKPTQKFLAYLASKTVGFCGSDLQALCAEAVMCCVRRNYPQIYTSKSKYNIKERHLKVEKQDFLKAQQNIVPASHRIVIAPIKSLSTKFLPLFQETLLAIMSRLQDLCPTGMLISDNITGKATSRSPNCPRILLCGEDDCHTRHLGPALLHSLEHLPCHILDVTTLFEETGRAAEEAIIQKMKAARRTLPSLLYVPDVLSWWDLVDETARVVFTSLMKDVDHSVHMLVVATANCNKEDLPSEIAALFNEHQGELFRVVPPDSRKRQSFFKQLFFDASPDDISNQSSQADFLQLACLRKGKGEFYSRKHNASAHSSDSLGIFIAHEVVETVTTRKGKWPKMRTKLGAVRSSHSSSPLKTRTQMKRESSASGEGPTMKRQKLMYGSTASSEKLVNPFDQELLQKIVQTTEQWSTDRLESLYASLEIVRESSDQDDVYAAMNECLMHFEELENLKAHIKEEDK